MRQRRRSAAAGISGTTLRRAVRVACAAALDLAQAAGCQLERSCWAGGRSKRARCTSVAKEFEPHRGGAVKESRLAMEEPVGVASKALWDRAVVLGCVGGGRRRRG